MSWQRRRSAAQCSWRQRASAPRRSTWRPRSALRTVASSGELAQSLFETSQILGSGGERGGARCVRGRHRGCGAPHTSRPAACDRLAARRIGRGSPQPARARELGGRRGARADHARAGRRAASATPAVDGYPKSALYRLNLLKSRQMQDGISLLAHQAALGVACLERCLAPRFCWWSLLRPRRRRLCRGRLTTRATGTRRTACPWTAERRGLRRGRTVERAPDNNAADSCFIGGTKENTPNQWAFNTRLPAAARRASRTCAGAWVHPESTSGTSFSHFGFWRNDVTGNSFLTFELNQSSAELDERRGHDDPVPLRQTTCCSRSRAQAAPRSPRRSTGGGATGSGPAACPNGANGFVRRLGHPRRDQLPGLHEVGGAPSTT